MFAERKRFTGFSLLGAALMMALAMPAYAAEVVGVGPDGNTFSQQTQNVFAESETAAGETAETAPEEAVPDPVPTETAHLDALTQNGQVMVTGNVSGTYSAEDGILYFFELQPWQDEISGQPVASCQEQGNFSFSLPLNEGSVDSRLYSSYVATVWLGGKYQII
ncbi:MAG: hypothetical protein IKI35_00055, partial [Stomatobaculum sp.]|nr:hypothetical protein [Stomatobaculum sp.]